MDDGFGATPAPPKQPVAADNTADQES